MYKIVILVSCLLYSIVANSTTIPVSSSGEYMMVPAKPSREGGVSFNDIGSESTVFKSKVKILNYPNLYKANKAASIIVLRSSNIDLRSQIEVIGFPATLVFTGNDENTNLACVNCRFKGAERVIFSGSLVLDDDSISAYKSAKLTTINELRSVSVPSLIVVSNEVSFSGNIDMRSKAKLFSGGVYEIGEQGTYYAGGSSFSLYAGDFKLDSSTFEPVILDSRDGLTKAMGIRYAGTGNVNMNSNLKLNATNFKLVYSGSDKLNIHGKVDTTSDILSSYNLDGRFEVAEEGISISSLSDSSIVFDASINTLGSVNFISDKSLKNDKNASVVSGDYQVSARKAFLNEGLIKSNQIYVTAESISNHSHINSVDIKFIASNLIDNSHGGRIFGKTIQLSSNDAFINGSRYKYITSYEAMHISNPDDRYPYHDDGMLLTENIYPLDDFSYLKNNNSARMGTFYMNIYHFKNAKYRIKIEDNSALIYGDSIIINAKYVENINPHYESAGAINGWKHGIPLDLYKSKQVGIVAEKDLEIVATSYIKNSSALIYLNEAKSEKALYLEAPTVANERYRMASLYNLSQVGTNDPNNKLLTPFHYIYSPPGQIRSVGKIKFKVSKEILNSSSFIESYRSIEVDSPKISSYGVNVSEEILATPSYKKLTSVNTLCLNAYASSDSCDPSNNEYVINAPYELDTLIYAGEGIKSNSNLTLDNFSLVDAFVRIIGERYFSKFISGCVFQCDQFVSAKIDFSKGELTVNYKDYSNSKCIPLFNLPCVPGSGEITVHVEPNWSSHSFYEYGSEYFGLTNWYDNIEKIIRDEVSLDLSENY